MNSVAAAAAARGRGLLSFRRSQRATWPLTSASPYSSSSSTLQPPDVACLAEAARITLSPQEVEGFEPKIRQVVDWFGQLQSVNVENFEPTLRADTEVRGEPRKDVPEMFENREALLESVPCLKGQFLRTPKVRNTE